MDERTLQIQACMYQYSRAIYRSIKDLVDPYVTPETRAQYRREVLDAWAVREGVAAAVAFIESQIEAGAFDGGIARCRATTRKGKPCQRTPLPERDYCPSHQHLERSAPRGTRKVAAAAA